MESWRQYVKLGINHHLLYPESMRSAEVHRNTLPVLLQDERFEVIDLFVPDEETFEREAEMILNSGKEIVYNCPLMVGDERNPHSRDSRIRDDTFAEAESHLLRAVRLGAEKMVVASGIDPGPERRSEETERFVHYLSGLCSRAPASLTLLIEPFDRSIGKNLLIGPTVEAVHVVERIKAMGHDNIGLLVDMGHVPLMEETFRFAIGHSAPHLKHIHLGSCVKRDPQDPLYGDMHPPWGYAGGEHDVPETTAFIRELFAAGYLAGGLRPTVTLEMRPYPACGERESVDVFLRKWNAAWAKLDERGGD